MDKYEALLQPMRIGKTVFKNRLLASPTSVPTLDARGHLTAQNIAYYEEKAKGGFACVTLGESVIYSKDGHSHDPQICLDDPSAVPSLTEMAEAIHSHNALASLEITHGGGMSNPKFNHGQNPIGPSAMISKQGYQVEEMSVEKIREVADAFGRAAAFAKSCGFDMCLIHGGHGWLLAQFLSPLTNHRTDEFGGSLENRMRFPLMVVDSIRRQAGRDFLIEYRFSGDEYYEGGYTIEEGVEIAKMLDGKVDLIHVSAGLHYLEPTLVKMHPSIFHRHGENVWLAEEIKKHVKTPVVTVGGLSEPDILEGILRDGKADFIAMGRQSLADPYLPDKLLHGREDEICPCIRCLECMGASLGFGPVELHCTVNPVVGREFKEQLRRPAKTSRKVLVAGGGPGGMEAAIVAAERGHKVILCEAQNRLGGALNVAEGVSFKQNVLRYRDYLIRELQRTGVEVRLGTKVDEKIVADIAPDALFASLGADPIVPPFAGIDLPHVILGGGAAEKAELGHRVTIIGGGLIGCELAVHLTQKGHEVTVVEMLDKVAKDAKLFHRIALMEQLEQVDVRISTKCLEILPEGIAVETPEGKRETIPADNVVVAVGLRPRYEETDALRSLVRDFVAIGDCLRVGKIGTAVRAGYDAAMDL